MQFPSETNVGSVSANDSQRPYLSVVVTARNDNHGGNMLHRMQVFVDALINQAKRYNLPSELIIVEWNPPPDRERMLDALRWPDATGPCRVRIIEVPAEVHHRYHHARALPLYQMIAKNVGIRRARGEFILATNIDIVFSDELTAFLAARKLEKGRMYRMDRTDVMSGVPVDGTLDEQLEYCRTHVIRVCAREGNFSLTGDGLRENEPNDITRPESAISFGEGWFPIQCNPMGERFRWLGNQAEVRLRVPVGGGVLALEVEPGPGLGSLPSPLQMLDASGVKVAQWQIAGRAAIEIVVPPVPDGGVRTLRLHMPDGGLPLVHDPRILNLRVYRCDWTELELHSPLQIPYRVAVRQSWPVLARLLATHRSSRGQFSLAFNGPALVWRTTHLLKSRGADIFGPGAKLRTGAGWHSLEQAGPGRFRWVERESYLVVRPWGEGGRLRLLAEPGPSVGFRPFVLIVRRSSGKVIARAHVDGLTYLEIPAPGPADLTSTLHFTAEGGGPAIGTDPRDLCYRVFACAKGRSRKEAAGPSETVSAGPWPTFIMSSLSEALDCGDSFEDSRGEIENMGRPVFLHTNGSGDFTMMAREDWSAIRGNAELDIFSMHVDSLLCYSAEHAGIREEVLPAPMRIYHIDHESGWTSAEGAEQLSARIARRGIPAMTYGEIAWFITQMRTLKAPVIFNLDDWGLATLALPEIAPAAVAYASRGGD